MSEASQQQKYIKQQFSEFLKRSRGTRSQAEFARFLGIKHQQTYQAYESGRVPDGIMLHQICSKLGVSLDEALTGSRNSLPSVDTVGRALSTNPSGELAGRTQAGDPQLLKAFDIIGRHIPSQDALGLVREILQSPDLDEKSKVFWSDLLTTWMERCLDA